MESPRTKLRWYQYSLRSLLIAVTLSCIACGLFIGPKHRRHHAIVTIEAVGGRVSYDDIPGDESWLKKTLRRCLPRDWFDKVDALDLHNCQKADESVFAAIEQFSELKGLRLNGSKIADAGLIHLTGLTNLRRLSLSSTQITDAGLIHLKGLTEMECLLLEGTKITNAGIEELKASLPDCWINH